MNIIDNILNLIFPNVCGICGKIEKNGLCKECKKKLKINERVYSDIGKNFEKHISIFDYDGEIRHNILLYKFKDKSYMYKTFAEIILNSKKICDILQTYDIIISVPVHKKRKMNRGYDQSELIAKEIAKNIKTLEYKKALKKIKNNQMQSSLNKNMRLQNVQDAYEAVNKEIIKNKKIILFDDIYTTGSTVNECSKVLKENGAKEILVLSLAR